MIQAAVFVVRTLVKLQEGKMAEGKGGKIFNLTKKRARRVQEKVGRDGRWLQKPNSAVGLVRGVGCVSVATVSSSELHNLCMGLSATDGSPRGDMACGGGGGGAEETRVKCLPNRGSHTQEAVYVFLTA